MNTLNVSNYSYTCLSDFKNYHLHLFYTAVLPNITKTAFFKRLIIQNLCPLRKTIDKWNKLIY